MIVSRAGQAWRRARAATQKPRMTAVRQDEYLTRDRYEALVIGSGFGGAVAAFLGRR